MAATTGCAQVVIVFYFGFATVISFFYAPNAGEVLIRFVFLAAIANVDNYFYDALAERESKDFIVRHYNEDELCVGEDEHEEEEEEEVEENEDEDE